MEREAFEIRQKYRDLKVPKSELKNTHGSFLENYPQLFDMVSSDSCDDDVLNKMFRARKMVTSGELNQHDASVMVGQNLVDKYVKPTMDSK